MTKPASEYTKDKQRPDGLAWQCGDCRRAYSKSRPEAKLIYDDRKRWDSYRITRDEFEAIKQSQYNACAICERPFSVIKKVVIDHCHKTNDVRGVLCSPFNVGLGCLGDDIAGLEKALIYLKTSKE